VKQRKTQWKLSESQPSELATKSQRTAAESGPNLSRDAQVTDHVVHQSLTARIGCDAQTLHSYTMSAGLRETALQQAGDNSHNVALTHLFTRNLFNDTFSVIKTI
jgi:hypothetical protein